jgi:chromosome segregation ATPase
MSGTRKRIARLAYPDLAEALQARLQSNLEPEAIAVDERARIQLLEAHIATLEATLAKAEALGEQRRQEAETATNRAMDLEAHIATLEVALANAESLCEQRQQEVTIAAKRVDELVGELFKASNELVDMSKLISQQTALTNRVRAEFDDYRSQSWWWQHGRG